jgi:hypothetical protein
MSTNMQAVLDFLARSDLDGRTGGPSLVWAVLAGLGFLIALVAIVAPFTAAMRGPRRVTRVKHVRDYTVLGSDGTLLYTGRTRPSSEWWDEHTDPAEQAAENELAQ